MLINAGNAMTEIGKEERKCCDRIMFLENPRNLKKYYQNQKNLMRWLDIVKIT